MQKRNKTIFIQIFSFIKIQICLFIGKIWNLLVNIVVFSKLTLRYMSICMWIHFVKWFILKKKISPDYSTTTAKSTISTILSVFTLNWTQLKKMNLLINIFVIVFVCQSICFKTSLSKKKVSSKSVKKYDGKFISLFLL